MIVVARGGGSVQDLLPFDDEGLCRAMFACDKPVVAAIGHTDNIPVCNHVTHSASTPSRSHELVVPSQTELRQELGLARQSLGAVPALLERQRERLAAAADRLGPSGVVDREAARLRDQLQRLCHAQGTFFTTRGQRRAS